jgi:hypothetical protein
MWCHQGHFWQLELPGGAHQAFALLVRLGEKHHHKLGCGEPMRPVREGTCGYNKHRLLPLLSL